MQLYNFYFTLFLLQCGTVIKNPTKKALKKSIIIDKIRINKINLCTETFRTALFSNIFQDAFNCRLHSLKERGSDLSTLQLNGQVPM